MIRQTAPVRTARVALAALALFAAAAARAAPIRPFTTAALQAAQAKGLPVLVDAHADWCPTCRAQAPTISALATDKSFARLVILKLNYDTQEGEKRALNIRHQSTLIAFAGARETGRSTGVTDPAAIRALAASALR
jgi:thiol-disulfide isomerase/thioredoxin